MTMSTLNVQLPTTVGRLYMQVSKRDIQRAFIATTGKISIAKNGLSLGKLASLTTRFGYMTSVGPRLKSVYQVNAFVLTIK